MSRHHYTAIVGITLAGAAMLAGLRLRQPVIPGAVVSSTAPTSVSPNSLAHVPTSPLTRSGATLFSDVLRDLRASGNERSDNVHLQTFATRMTEFGRPGSVAAIREFLATGDDTPTRQAFALGSDGFLTGTPTLRVFLLDLLERLDPGAAAEQAKTILRTSTSADEWAVAMRSLARGAPSDRDLLAVKLHELLHNGAWRAAPSTGWLEAFDVAVHLGGAEFVPDLTELLRPMNGQTLNHAAFLALDRLSAREPAAVLPALLDQKMGLDGREALRAGLVARADVRDPAQCALVERYLLDPARTSGELESFAGIYPNANAFVSANLLTTVSAPPSGSIARHDAAALTIFEKWLNDPRFARVTPQLERIRDRLIEFTRPPR